ncbi:sensor histidine kinase [Deinococcus radiopugnans]|uniref:histidine kinase n=2 Tax=Deinococcus radiopugnans ATCC 19172 TaxID=585398 RepID=A0ABR6NVI5_9DEIO|nr:ATP-binding protein [Deinococcus radiopugnans]MBB6018016.1 two-component system sensor histidine kinase BaeS [Deinococcus radiopugnans ATCC 19172]
MKQTPASRRRGLSLGFTLLLAMLAVVGLSVGSTFVFSNLAVQGEFRRLPPEVQQYLRAQQEAQRRGEVIVAAPTPQIRTGTPADPYLPPGRSSPDVNGVVRGAGGNDIVIEAGARVRGRDDSGGPPRGFTPRTQDFLENIQRNLLQVGLLAAAASALLAFVLSRRLARPILAVSAAAAGLARGDLSVRAPVLSGERELAELAGNFNEMAANLQRLENERRQAVADIAHELRTPLAIMQARLDALEDGVYTLSPEQVALLSQQTQQLTRLVDDLRTLTLAEAGRLRLQPGALDLAALSAGVVRDLTDRAGARGVTLQLNAPHPAPLHADAGRVRQIAVNLLENALQHACSRVQISVETSGAQAWLHVDDDGPGIPEPSREAVFTRFTRLDSSRTRGTGGSGLGLAIVQELAHAHGGEARAERGPLGGARFTVRLPLSG